MVVTRRMGLILLHVVLAWALIAGCESEPKACGTACEKVGECGSGMMCREKSEFGSKFCVPDDCRECGDKTCVLEHKGDTCTFVECK